MELDVNNLRITIRDNEVYVNTLSKYDRRFSLSAEIGHF
jgi:hypothetical protein